MQRLAFARHARNYIISSSSSRIPNPSKKVSFSISNLLLLQSSSISSSSSRVRLFPQFSFLSNPPRFFSQITEQNGVVLMDEFENVLSLLLQNNAAADGSLESDLNSLHLTTLNQHFLLKVIETPNVSGHNLMTFIKWLWKKTNNNNKSSFKVVTTPVLESLVSAICRGRGPDLDQWQNDIYFLWDLVKDIGHSQSGVLNARILNQLIISFYIISEGNTALEAFDKFEVFQCVPNQDTYYYTILALARTRNFENFNHVAWSICQKMLLDPEGLPDDEKVGDIISCFCLTEMGKEAYALFLAAKQIRKQLNIKFYSDYFDDLLSTLCEEKETVHLALEMLNDIPEVEGEPEWKRSMFTTVVLALCSIKDVDAAKQLILRMIADGPPPNNIHFKLIITAYTKAGEMGQAMEMVKLLESIGLEVDLCTYEVLMSGYPNSMEEARRIFEEAKKKHSKLRRDMYHTLIRGYCKLEQFDEALKLLTEMKDFGLCPIVDEYEKLIQSLYLKAMDWEMAEKLLEEMKDNGVCDVSKVFDVYNSKAFCERC